MEAVSTVSEIPNAIALSKAAASIALVVDVGSNSLVWMVNQIESSGGSVANAYKISGQAEPFTTQKASTLIFDAIADSIISGDIADSKLKSFGSDGTTDDMAIKIKDILEPLTKTVLGSNYDDYQNALVNEAKVLAAGVHRIDNKPFNSDSFPTTSNSAYEALKKDNSDLKVSGKVMLIKL